MWLYHGAEVTPEVVSGYKSFVYLITRLDTGRMYIGKKRLLRKITRAPLKGKKRKRVSYDDSDWREYYGSNEDLQNEVAKLGPRNFRREILMLCPSHSIASYVEIKYQLLVDAIPSERYYNLWFSAKVRSSHLRGLDLEKINDGVRLLQEREKQWVEPSN